MDFWLLRSRALALLHSGVSGNVEAETSDRPGSAVAALVTLELAVRLVFRVKGFEFRPTGLWA